MFVLYETPAGYAIFKVKQARVFTAHVFLIDIKWLWMESNYLLILAIPIRLSTVLFW